MRLDREQSLDNALGQIERQFGKGSVMRMNDAAQVSTGAVSTGRSRSTSPSAWAGLPADGSSRSSAPSRRGRRPSSTT
jgi:recombination protein RecA